MTNPFARLLFLALAASLSAQSPARPLAAVIDEARKAVPPAFPRGSATPDLVELDPSIRLDIRYATADNFLHAPVYDQPRAFLQRPVAEALLRVDRALRATGFALRVHDAYRPWWVTRVFWDVTAPADRDYVADPAKGSVHNRGCAVDVDLLGPGGAPLPMPSAYDEMSVKSHAAYAGGDAQARANRDLLRAAMAREGFTVLKEEWWHFDHASSPGYSVLNVPFDAIRDRSGEFGAAGQVLLVTTSGWDAVQGSLQRFERAGGTLVKVGAPLPVWLGTKGLAWRSDDGAPPPPAAGPVKREGDQRSPAGVLTFGGMWGYAAQPPEGVKLPYRPSTDCDRCVDDPDHADYGRIVSTGGAAPTWRSAERLRLETDHYRWLVVIHYNDLRPVKGAGSCIFLHVAPAPGGGTAGCTALAPDDLLTLLRWLDPARNPLLVQVPDAALASAAAAWHLPSALNP